MARSKRRNKPRNSPLYRVEKPVEKVKVKAPKSGSGWLPPLTAVVLVLAAGVVYGLQTNRWIPSRELAEAAARLDNIPREFNGWEGTDMDVDPEEMRIAGAVGSLRRVYRNKQGKTVSVMVLCGAHGPISLHPPTVCFTSAGWSFREQPKPTVIKDQKEERRFGSFFVTRFQKRTETHVARMRTCWAWNADGTWESPDKPRYAFAGSGHLYKIYVSEMLPPDDGDPAERKAGKDKGKLGACEEFIRDFIPVLKKAGI